MSGQRLTRLEIIFQKILKCTSRYRTTCRQRLPLAQLVICAGGLGKTRTVSEVRGYLLDVNHVSAHFRGQPSFMERFRLVPSDTQWRICSITLGEIEASHRMSVSTDPERRNDYARFVIEEYAYNAVEIT